MRDWAQALRESLNQRDPRLADAAGLTESLSATAFEETIGALLRWRDLRPIGKRFQQLGGPNPGSYSTGVEEDYERSGHRLEQIVNAINATLYELFGSARISDAAAEDAYGRILNAANTSRLWFATTNYDPAIEIALEALGRTPVAGFTTPRGGRRPVLQLDGLVDRAEQGVVPVVHLHGAVGWYEQGGTVRQAPTDEPFDPNRGRSVVLHPDPDKDPTQDTVVSELWREFEAMLNAASHVLVLGHSLHDPALLRKLIEASPTTKIAITYFEGDPESKQHLEQQRKRFKGDLLTLPAVFGPGEAAVLGGVERWLRQDV